MRPRRCVAHGWTSGTAFELVGWRAVQHAVIAETIAGERPLASAVPTLTAAAEAGLGVQLVAIAPTATVAEIAAAATTVLAELDG